MVKVVFMSNTDTEKKDTKFGVRAKLAVSSAMITLMSMVSFVSAGSLNDSISPILTDVATIFTPLLALIIAAVPLIIAVAVIGFVMGIFKAILDKIGM